MSIVIDRAAGPAYQGDLLIAPIDAIPEGLTEERTDQEDHVVAHSETGHHHVLAARAVQLYVASAVVAYLRVREQVAVRHLRPHDTHEALVLPPGDYQLLRQREGLERRMVRD